MPQEAIVAIVAIVTSIVIPLGVLFVAILNYIFNSFKKSNETRENRIAQLESRVESLEGERDTYRDAKAQLEDELEQEREDKERRKREREQERQRQQEAIRKLNEQHTKDIEQKVKQAVEAVTREHQTTIDNLKRENNEAIELKVQEAVKPLHEQIQTLTQEKQQHETDRQQWTQAIEKLTNDYNDLKAKYETLEQERNELKERVGKIEKKSTDDLPPPPENMPDP